MAKLRKPKISHQNSIASSIIGRLVHKDDYILFEVKKIWKILEEIAFYAEESEVSEYKAGTIILTAKNSVIKNEILLKKDEIKGLINVYLQDKIGENNYPIKRVIVK